MPGMTTGLNGNAMTENFDLEKMLQEIKEDDFKIKSMNVSQEEIKKMFADKKTQNPEELKSDQES